MLNYIIRRTLFMIPIVFGVMLITFVLFFVVQSPDQMARRILGSKAPPETIANWLENRGYDNPRFLNLRQGANPFDSLFFNSMKSLLVFDLGKSDITGEPVIEMFRQGALPSLLLTLPAFVAGLLAAIGLSLFLVYVRDSALDTWGIVLCVALMSIPIMVYVIFGQWVLANQLKYFPVFGFSMDGIGAARFLALPVSIMVLGGIGSDVRLFRTIFLEEIRTDYVRTALAKGASNARVLGVHVLKNGMISLITLIVASLPFLIMGSLVIENFFGIPGLGNLAIKAIHTSDFSVVRTTVYLGSLLYLGGLLLTDICYAAVDPRIRLS
jgi:peptide/nickel transport system permease protein